MCSEEGLSVDSVFFSADFGWIATLQQQMTRRWSSPHLINGGRSKILPFPFLIGTTYIAKLILKDVLHNIFFIVCNILQRFTPALPYPRPQPAIPYHLPRSIPSRARCALQPWNPWKPRTAMAVVRLALAGLVRRPARCLVRSASSTSVMSHSEFVDIVDCVLGCEEFGNLSKHSRWFEEKNDHLMPTIILALVFIGLCMSFSISPMDFVTVGISFWSDHHGSAWSFPLQTFEVPSAPQTLFNMPPEKKSESSEPRPLASNNNWLKVFNWCNY